MNCILYFLKHLWKKLFFLFRFRIFMINRWTIQQCSLIVLCIQNKCSIIVRFWEGEMVSGKTNQVDHDLEEHKETLCVCMIVF